MRGYATVLLLPLLATTFACSSPTAEAPASEGPSASMAVEAERHDAPQLTAPVIRDQADIDVAALEAAGGVAYFAGGCFWGVEHFMEQIDGVLRVESGYMGGHVDDPSYEEVSSRESGHYETVRIYFDPERVEYRAIAKRFFEIHDPTQTDGQGPDIGPEYLSAVFVTSPEQRAAVEELIGLLEGRGYDVATTIEPAETFWIAEDYHQNYYALKGKQPYCHTPVDRFGD